MQHSEKSVELLQDLLEEITDRGAELTERDVDELVALYPEREDTIRRMALAVCAMQTLSPQPKLGGDSIPKDGSQLPEQLGDFRIVREIARGGMGIVFEAEQLSLSRRVALKLLPTVAMLDSVQVARFRREALAVAKLQHPHIVSVYAVGFEAGIHFYAMQLIDGLDLARMIRHDPRIATDKPDASDHSECSILAIPCTLTERARYTANLGLQAAQALSCAHQAGVIHRDIKPSNLLIDQSGELYVADFGLAHHGADAALTATGNVVGTLKYVSPEQAANSSQVDHRTDIFSLGLTLFETLTGSSLRSGSPEQMLRQALDCPMPTFEPQFRRHCLDLLTIIGKCLEREPVCRYQTAQELSDDLRAYLDHRPIRAKPIPLTRRLLKWCRRNPSTVRGLAISSAVLLAMAAVFAVWILGERKTRIGEQQLREAQAVRLESELHRNRIDSYVSSIQMAFQAWNHNSMHDVQNNLNACLPGSGEQDVRGFEWYYLQSMINSAPQPIGRHEGMAYYVEFMPGTNDFVTAGNDGLRVWKAGKEYQYLEQKPYGSQWIDFSEDGSRMLSASATRVILWDTSTWTEIRSYDCELAALAAEFVRGQDTAVIVERPEGMPQTHYSIVRLVDLPSGKNHWRHVEHGTAELEQRAEGVAVSANNNLITVAYSAGQVSLMDLGSGKVLSSTNLPSGANAVGYSPDEKYVAVGAGDGTVRFWRTGRTLGKPVFQFTVPGGGISSLQFWHHEYILVSSGDGTISSYYFFLEDRGGPFLYYRHRHFDPVWCCRLLPSEERSFATVDRVGRVCLTDNVQLSVQNAFEIRAGDYSKMTAEQKLAFAEGSRYYDASPDGRLAVVHELGRISIWNLSRNECVKQVTVAELRKAISSIPDGLDIESVRFLPDSRRIVIDLCHAIVTYDVESGACTEWLISEDKSKHYFLPTSAPLFGNRALIRQGWSSPALLLETDQPGTVREIGDLLNHVCWGHDGTYIIEFRPKGIIVVTDVATGKEKHRFVFGSTANPAISPDGRTLALHQGTDIVLCNILTGREMLRIPIAIRGEKAMGLRFSDRGRRLTAEFQYVHRWQNAWQLDANVELKP